MGKKFPGRPKIKVLDAPTWANERWIESVIDKKFIRTEPKFKRPGLYLITSNHRQKTTLLEYKHNDEMRAYFIDIEHWETEVRCIDFSDMKLNYSKTVELVQLATRLPRNISIPLLKLYQDEILRYHIKIQRVKNLKILKDVKDKFKRLKHD